MLHTLIRFNTKNFDYNYGVQLEDEQQHTCFEIKEVTRRCLRCRLDYKQHHLQRMRRNMVARFRSDLNRHEQDHNFTRWILIGQRASYA